MPDANALSSDALSSRIVFAIPVASDCIDKASAYFAQWKKMGYATAALLDTDGDGVPENCDVSLRCNSYEGYAWAVNVLADMLTLPEFGGYDWLIIGGHDVLPDPNYYAGTIAEECLSHFGGTFGVMQPCGDAYGALADKSACVSAWIGADFCKRFGPLHSGYFHFWADTELKEVAEREGVLWWRDDLTQYHDHHLRHPKAKGDPSHPPHLSRAVSHHDADKALFEARKTAGFPVLDPLSCAGISTLVQNSCRNGNEIYQVTDPPHWNLP